MRETIAPREAPSHALQDADPNTTPFNTAVLCQELAQVFTPGRILLEGETRAVNGRLVAHLILSRRPRRIGPLPLRQLDAAAGHHTSLTDMLHDPSFPDAAPALLRALGRTPEWDLLECRAVPRDGSLAAAAMTVGALVISEPPALAIDLTADGPIASVSKLRELRRLRKRLTESRGLSIDILSPGHALWRSMPRSFAELHRARWHGSTTPSPFENARVRARFEAWLAEPGQGVVPVAAVLASGSKIAGVVIAFDDGNRMHAWRMAYRTDLRKYSPGIQLLTALAVHLGTMGRASLELGRGDDPYKHTWRTTERPRVTVRWISPTWRTRLLDQLGRVAGRDWLKAWRHAAPR